MWLSSLTTEIVTQEVNTYNVYRFDFTFSFIFHFLKLVSISYETIIAEEISSSILNSKLKFDTLLFFLLVTEFGKKYQFDNSTVISLQGKMLFRSINKHQT